LVFLAIIFSAGINAFCATGVILSAGEDASVMSGGARVTARTGVQVKSGDVVKATRGDVLVLLSDGRTVPVKEGTDYIVPSGEASSGEDKFSARVVNAIAEITMKADGPKQALTTVAPIPTTGEGPTVKGMVRGTSKISLVYPRNSFVRADSVKFEWKGADGTAEVEVFVKAPSPQYKHSFKVKSGKTTAALPADAPKLDAGVKYYWKVREAERVDSEPVESDLCWFAIIGPEKDAKLKAEIGNIDGMTDLTERNRLLMRAGLLMSYDLRHQAVSELEDGAKKYPDDNGIKYMLKNVSKVLSNPDSAGR
jgi:hypothetical protein